MSDRIEVSCAVEGDYAPHCAAMLHSLLAQHEPGEIRIHYLHGPDLPRDAIDSTGRMVEASGGEIGFLEVDRDLCEGLPIRGFTGEATWYRIFLPDLLGDLNRALNLDVDAIVTAPLRDLWATDLEGAVVAAVTNVLDLGYIDRPAALGIEPAQYFNAGVMLLDLEAMRRQDLCASLRRFGIDHADELVLRDQDALNAVLAPLRLPLPPRWNCMNAFWTLPWSAYIFDAAELDAARRDPAIRHFEGPSINKPWHYSCDRESRDLYLEHRRATPWPEVQLEGATLRRRLGRIRRRLSA